jgi:hypothetical protein
MARSVEQSSTAAVEKMREYNLRIIDMACANAEAAFELARQLTTAKTPSEFIELWTSHARKQFEMFSEQTKDLTALGQKMVAKVPSHSPAASIRLSRKPRNFKRWPSKPSLTLAA